MPRSRWCVGQLQVSRTEIYGTTSNWEQTVKKDEVVARQMEVWALLLSEVRCAQWGGCDARCCSLLDNVLRRHPVGSGTPGLRDSSGLAWLLCTSVWTCQSPFPIQTTASSIRLLIALGPSGLRGALEARSGWLALLVKLASKNHRYPNPALLCPADMFLMQFLCSSGQSCLAAPLGPG